MEPANSNAANSRVWLFVVCAAMALLLLWCAPLFICQPLWADATHYDVLAQEVLRGRTLYLDVSDTNFPGAVWIHMLVRAVAGKRSEMLRGFDLLVVVGIAGTLTHVATVSRTRAGALRIFGVAAILLYYFACTPMVHCQRDVWMLLPAALAIWLRQRRITNPQNSASRVFAGALAEGLLWGAAVWIKPYVIVPALACWLTGLAFGLRSRGLNRLEAALDALGLLIGGTLAGGAGCAWLLATGSWSPFWDIILHWSGEYRSSGNAGRLRFTTNLAWYVYYSPWSLLTFVAVPWAFSQGWRSLRDAKSESTGRSLGAGLLLSSLYLAWLLQASIIQLSHEYVLAVSPLIAIPLLCCWDRVALPSPSMRLAMVVLLAWALAVHPLLKPRALTAWPLCFTEGSSPLVKDRLSTDARRNVMGEAHWQDLHKVADYLRSRGVGDGDLAVWDDSSHVLFTELNISPSSRFVHAANWLVFFPSRREQITREIQQSNPRFVVTDVQMAGYSAFVAREDFQRDEPTMPIGMPPDLKSFPWNEPIVFRAGRYLVHEIPAPDSDDLSTSSSR